MSGCNKIYYSLFVVFVCGYIPISVNAEDSTNPNVLPPTGTPQRRVVKQITMTYAAPLFATNPNQIIYSANLLSAAGSCPTTTVQTTPIIPGTTYSIQIGYYATHVHFECDTTITGWCVTTQGHDPTAP